MQSYCKGHVKFSKQAFKINIISSWCIHESINCNYAYLL